ncbi:nitrogenase component 1 [Breznakiella homolactica]|uniref:Nitrogenase/oxidoreductase component 1 domain-containing protein n=1 Tax=Breznakiella homolactica TaxID=2798577 RepID=A0A7T7XK74_9SPIR|nr:nitrogenase component 1 [Breznakiella homolactica]QQO07763.1 nitrogenase component 1 [Breznakiella homolactica]
MSQILYNLPPLSPDYSGVASVFHDLGALTVIHDASGCTGTYTGYDEPRWFGSRSPVFCSGLRDMDAIMGDDDRLADNIITAAKETGAPCITVIGSPVPMVVGFDFRGFASLVEHRTGIPAFGFAATGLEYYDKGQRDAYIALADRFLPEQAKPDSRKVNILGASVLDGFDGPAMDALESLANEAGLQVNTVWGARSSLEELKSAGNAGFNWVVTAAALPLARWLEKRYGTSFAAGLPIGGGETGRIARFLRDAAAGKAPAAALPVPGRGGKPAAVIAGEALFAASLRVCMENEYGIGPAAIATFFGEGREFLGETDRFLVTEDDAREVFSGGTVETVIADPLMEDLLPETSGAAFIPVPHRAVSGRLHSESCSRYFGAGVRDILAVPVR